MKPSNHIEKLLLTAVKHLKKAGVDTPELDAEVLLAYTLKKDRLQLPLILDSKISNKDSQKFFNLIKRRGEREPVAYIINRKEFFSKEFYVDADVLIPRPETEILVETSQELIDKNFDGKSLINILEIGTGSGIISYLLAEFIQYANIIATDISDAALNVAKKNCSNKQFLQKINFVKSDLYSEFNKQKYKEYFHIIISNPPYISEYDYNNLAIEITGYEPKNALIGGKIGSEFIKKLIEEGIHFLKEEGFFIIELGFNLSKNIKNIVENLDFSIRFVEDLQGIKRVAIISKKGD